MSPEIIDHQQKREPHVCLSIYPRPEYIGFDNGGEYKQVFQRTSK
jgi:hypothetical protein